MTEMNPEHFMSQVLCLYECSGDCMNTEEFLKYVQYRKKRSIWIWTRNTSIRRAADIHKFIHSPNFKGNRVYRGNLKVKSLSTFKQNTQTGRRRKKKFISCVQKTQVNLTSDGGGCNIFPYF